MLAAREVVQESTGFSPNEFLDIQFVGLYNDLVVTKPPKNLVDDVNAFRRCVYCMYCSCGSGM